MSKKVKVLIVYNIPKPNLQKIDKTNREVKFKVEFRNETFSDFMNNVIV